MHHLIIAAAIAATPAILAEGAGKAATFSPTYVRTSRETFSGDVSVGGDTVRGVDYSSSRKPGNRFAPRPASFPTPEYADRSEIDGIGLWLTVDANGALNAIDLGIKTPTICRTSCIGIVRPDQRLRARSSWQVRIADTPTIAPLPLGALRLEVERFCLSRRGISSHLCGPEGRG